MLSHEPCNLIMTRFTLMSVCTQCSRHSSDTIASLVVLLENSDSIQEFLIFLHSFARVSNTMIKGAPAGMGESARSGNGYLAAMCCLNCIVNDEIFFLSLQYHQDACSSIPASSLALLVLVIGTLRFAINCYGHHQKHTEKDPRQNSEALSVLSRLAVLLKGGSGTG